MARRATGVTLDVGELRRHLGEQRGVRAEFPVPEARVGDVTTRPGALISLDLILESIPGGVRVTGTASVPWVGPCRRCLEPAEGVDDSQVDEIFAVVAVEGETYPLNDDRLDLEPLLRDLSVLALPLLPLCRPDCPGPEPQAFPIGEGASGSGGDDSETEPGAGRDPRWAPLDQLRDRASGPDSPAPPSGR